MRYLLIFLLSTFFLASCSREDTVGETLVEPIDVPPVEIEVGDINGIVKDNNGQLLSSATVKLYNETELVSETSTNSFGEFYFVDVFQHDEYKLMVVKDSYFASIAFVSDEHFNNEEVEIDLFFGISQFPFIQPTDLLDPNYILLYGTISDADQEPVETNLFIINSEGSYLYQTKVNNGDYAVLVPKNQEIAFFIYPNDPGMCTLFPEEIRLGPFEENTERNFQSEESTSSTFVEGFVSVCDSTALANGTLEYWSFVDGENVQVDIVDGQFSFEYEDCDFDHIQFNIIDDFGEVIYFGFIEDVQFFLEINIDCDLSCDFGEATLTVIESQAEFNFGAIAFANEFSTSMQIVLIGQDLSEIGFLSFVDNNSNTSTLELINFIFQIENQLYSAETDESVEIEYSIEMDSMNPFKQNLSASFEITLVDISGFSTLDVVVEIESPIFMN